MISQITESDINVLKSASKKLRSQILTMIHNSKSGHPGGALSCIDILNVLFSKVMKHYPECNKNPNYFSRDRFVLSKGHASAALYAVMAPSSASAAEQRAVDVSMSRILSITISESIDS